MLIRAVVGIFYARFLCFFDATFGGWNWEWVCFGFAGSIGKFDGEQERKWRAYREAGRGVGSLQTECGVSFCRGFLRGLLGEVAVFFSCLTSFGNNGHFLYLSGFCLFGRLTFEVTFSYFCVLSVSMILCREFDIEFRFHFFGNWEFFFLHFITNEIFYYCIHINQI